MVPNMIYWSGGLGRPQDIGSSRRWMKGNWWVSKAELRGTQTHFYLFNYSHNNSESCGYPWKLLSLLHLTGQGYLVFYCSANSGLIRNMNFFAYLCNDSIRMLEYVQRQSSYWVLAAQVYHHHPSHWWCCNLCFLTFPLLTTGTLRVDQFRSLSLPGILYSQYDILSSHSGKVSWYPQSHKGVGDVFLSKDSQFEKKPKTKTKNPQRGWSSPQRD